MLLNFIKREIAKKKVSREIKILKDKRGFIRAGLPRFNRLFGRDSLISAWQLLDKNPGICQATLEILSQYQGKVFNKDKEEEPGKILHETDLEKSHHPENFYSFPYYGSIDSTPLFLIIFSFYFEKTYDKKFLNSHWENILKAINWIEESGDKDKDFFLEYQRKNEKGLFHQGWKDGFEDHLKIEPPVALVEVQGYQYLSLKEISLLAGIKRDWDLAKRLQDRAGKLKEEFNKKFWMPGKNFYCLALDGKKEQKKSITSNPGHLLFTGIIDKEKIDFVVKRIFEDDLWTPFGIRNHSMLEPDFNPKSYHLGSVWPHDNWIIAQGLKKLGKKSEYQKIKNAILLAYQKIGYLSPHQSWCGGLPEFYGVIDGKIILEMKERPCYPQAWSSGALFNFLLE